MSSAADGVIVHKFLTTDHIDVRTLESATISVRSANYEIDLPSAMPSVPNVSLVVKGISDNLILLDWDLAASSSTVITAANANTITLLAPQALANDYHILFPDLDNALTYPGRVLSVESDDLAGTVQLKFEKFELISEPSIVMGATEFNFKLQTESMPTDSVTYFFPHYANGVDYTGKALAVDSISTVGANHLGVHFGFVDLINSPVFTSVDAAKAVALIDPGSVSVAAATLRFPRIDIGSDFVGAFLICGNDDTVGGMELAFSNGQLLMDNLVFSPTTVTKPASTANSNTLRMAPALTSNVAHLGKVMKATTTTANTIELSFRDLGELVSASGETVTVGVATNTVTHSILMPPRNTVSVQHHGVFATSDTTTGGGVREIQLGFSRDLLIGSDFGTNTNVTRITSAGNQNSYTLYLPGNKLSNSFSEIRGHVLGVTATTATSVELEFMNPFLISNANQASTLLLAVTDPLLTNDYTVKLPSIDKNQASNHYQNRVVQIASTNNVSEVQLAFETLDAFSGITEVDLVSAVGGGRTSIVASTSGASYSMKLPTAASAQSGRLLSVSSVSTVSGTVLSTQFSDPGILRASTSGKLLELRAPDGLASAYSLTFPEFPSAEPGHGLLAVSADGQLEFAFPTALTLVDGAQQVRVRSGGSDQDVSIVLPQHIQSPLNLQQGKALLVSSQGHGVESSIQTSYESPLKIFSQVSDGFQLNLSATSTQVTTTSGATVDTAFTLFSETASGFVKAAAQTDLSQAGDLADVSLAIDASAALVLESSASGFTLEIDGADAFRASFELAFPVFADATHAQRSNLMQIRSLSSASATVAVSVRVAADSPLFLATFSPAAGSDADRFFVSQRRVDFYALTLGERVLVAGQQNASHNGIYSVTTVLEDSLVLSRDGDFDTPQKMSRVSVIDVLSGLAHAGTVFQSVNLFVRRGSGTVSAASSTTVTGAGTLFTSELQAGDVIKLPDGSEILVSVIVDDTTFTSSETISSSASGVAFQIASRPGSDALYFDKLQGDASGAAHARLDMAASTRTPELLIGAAGHETRIVSAVRNVCSRVEFSAMTASAHKQFLVPLALSDVLEGNRSLQGVVLGASRARKHFRATASSGLVALTEEGVDFSSSIVTLPNRNLAIVWSASSSSASACLSLQSRAHGTGVSSATYGLLCERSGLYELVLNLALEAHTVAAALTLANNAVDVEIRSDAGVADAARAHTCRAHLVDIEVFRRNQALTRQVEFRAELAKGTTYFVQVRHTQGDATLKNGVLKVGSCTLLARLVA